MSSHNGNYSQDGWNTPTQGQHRNRLGTATYVPQYFNHPNVQPVADTQLGDASPSRRPPPHPNTNPDPYNVFSTGSMVEALEAGPSSPSRGSPARPPTHGQRKATHGHGRTRSGSGSTGGYRHPASPTRQQAAARAARVRAVSPDEMYRALYTEDGWAGNAQSHETPRARPRAPLGVARQPTVSRRSAAAARPEQLQATLGRRAVPQAGTRRVGGMYTGAGQGQRAQGGGRDAYDFGYGHN